MKIHKNTGKTVLITLLFLIVICIPIFIYITYIQYLGFPDGHLTELDRTEKTLFNYFIIISILFIVISLYLGFIKVKIRSLFSLLMLFFSYIFILVIFYGISLYLSTILKDGVGG